VNDLVGNGAKILARRISAKGALGATITIAPEGTSVSHLRIASSANAGTSTVVWSTDSGGDSAVIKSVRVSGAGAGGTEIPLTGPTESAYDPTIAAASDGTFTVAWRKSIGALDSAQVRRIAPSGKLGTTRTLGSSSLTTAGDVTLATAANGLTSILWTEVGETSNVIRFSQVDSRRRASRIHGLPASTSGNLQGSRGAVLSAGATGPTRIVFQRRNNGSEGPSLQISSWK
jgi:hypothetical protein